MTLAHASVLKDDRFPSAEKSFLRSYLRNEQAVYKKLRSLVVWKYQPALPLFFIESIFEKEGIPLPRVWVNEVMTYLCQFLICVWLRSGPFHLSLQKNLAIALDLAIAQAYLPRAGKWIQKLKVLRENLRELLNGKYPHAASVLSTLAG